MLVLLVPVALYIPSVQDFAVRRTLSVLNHNEDDLRYDIGLLRLRFPLEIELWDVCLSKASTHDTLVYVHHLQTALDDYPWGEQRNFVVGQLLVETVRTGIDTTLVSGLDLRGSLDTLRIQDVTLCLDSNAYSVGSVLLDAPHFEAHYVASGDSIENEQDTTTNGALSIQVGLFDLRDAHVHYDGWKADSLNLHLEQFVMHDDLLQLDTLALTLPQSHIGVSSRVNLSFLADSTQGWANAAIDIALSHQDLAWVAGDNFPELFEKYLPDSVGVESRFSLYLTPDQMQVTPLLLRVPGFVEVEGKVEARHPLDNYLRQADVQMGVSLTHCDPLLTALLGTPEERGYRLPNDLKLTLSATQQNSFVDAWVELQQDALARLKATASGNLQDETYRADLRLSHLYVGDYVPGVRVDNVNLQCQVEGQHYDVLDSLTQLSARLRLDTLRYELHDDSTEMDITLRHLHLLTDLHHDSLTLHTNIGLDVKDLLAFDALRLDLLHSPEEINLQMGVGDAFVKVQAGCDINGLMEVADSVMHELDMQSTNRAFDINQLQKIIPPLSVQIGMKQDNPFVPLLHQQGIGFDSLSVRLTNTDSLRLYASIDTLQYEGVKIAHVGARLRPRNGNYDYLAGALYQDTLTGMDFSLRVKARLMSDSIIAQGGLRADSMPVFNFDALLTNRLKADVRLASLPLALANGFLSDDMKLSGYLNGRARLDCDSVDFNALRAALWFDSASVWYEGCDMTLGLPQDSITYQEGVLRFNRIRFLTQNKKPIILDGTIDLREHIDNPDIDLIILSDNAQLIRNKKRRNKGQFLCGTLPLSLQMAVVGALDRLKVTGQISIPQGCDLTYYYEDDGSVSSNSQLNDLVEFVSFDEVDSRLDSLRQSGKLPQRPHEHTSNMDVNLKLRIDRNTQVLAYLPTSSDDKVQIKGGGEMKLWLNDKGDLQLSGGYDVSGGDINFKLPMLPVTKQFGLTNDSWLRWSGIVDQPELNLTATENVRCTINDVSSGARVVKFVVSILIRGTLENMDIVFDCSAPDDAAIQSELATLTDEERSKQALMLLVAQTYNGPSASASAGMSSANAAISNLINKELESLLTNKLKHTEINVGIDTYDANGTGTQQTDYSVSVSQRFFNDRMRVTVGGKMSTGEEVQQDEASIISDVSLEWLIKPDASQYARLFRHTNYESVLEGEVVETGVGYVQKRDAYKFKHLFIRSRKKRDEARREMLRQLQVEEIERVREEAKKDKKDKKETKESTNE